MSRLEHSFLSGVGLQQMPAGGASGGPAKLPKEDKDLERRLLKYGREFNINISRIEQKEKQMRSSMLAYSERMNDIRYKRGSGTGATAIELQVRAKHIPRRKALPKIGEDSDKFSSDSSDPPSSRRRHPKKTVMRPFRDTKQTGRDEIRLNLVDASDLCDLIQNGQTKREESTSTYVARIPQVTNDDSDNSSTENGEVSLDKIKLDISSRKPTRKPPKEFGQDSPRRLKFDFSQVEQLSKSQESIRTAKSHSDGDRGKNVRNKSTSSQSERHLKSLESPRTIRVYSDEVEDKEDRVSSGAEGENNNTINYRSVETLKLVQNALKKLQEMEQKRKHTLSLLVLPRKGKNKRLNFPNRILSAIPEKSFIVETPESESSDEHEPLEKQKLRNSSKLDVNSPRSSLDAIPEVESNHKPSLFTFQSLPPITPRSENRLTRRTRERRRKSHNDQK